MLIPQMNGSFLDARIDGCGVDIDSVELFENMSFVLDYDSADFNPILAGIRKRCLMSKQQKCARLRLDARISSFCLDADDRI